MNHLIAQIKTRKRQKLFKVLSEQEVVFDVDVDQLDLVDYAVDHNLDEESWFKIEQFSQQTYCLDFMKSAFVAADYNDLIKDNFEKIAFLCASQGDNLFFQKVAPSTYLHKKFIGFGDVAHFETSQTRLAINALPDAIYLRHSDMLVFRKLATISSVFTGIDELYKEATNAEVEQFLDEEFIELSNDYNVENVSKPNRKRIALAMATLETMSLDDKANMLSYIDDYCGEQRLTFDQDTQKFEISTDEELKLLLYGIEQRFYTTQFSHEKRLANSVITMG